MAPLDVLPDLVNPLDDDFLAVVQHLDDLPRSRRGVVAGSHNDLITLFDFHGCTTVCRIL